MPLSPCHQNLASLHSLTHSPGPSLGEELVMFRPGRMLNIQKSSKSGVPIPFTTSCEAFRWDFEKSNGDSEGQETWVPNGAFMTLKKEIVSLGESCPGSRRGRKGQTKKSYVIPTLQSFPSFLFCFSLFWTMSSRSISLSYYAW